MTNDLEALLLKYIEQVQFGQEPDLTQPPYNSAEFQKLLKKYGKVDRALGKVRETNPVAAALPNIPGVKIISELGRGGGGRVFLAKDLDLERLVAVKIIPKFNNEQMIQRFKQESKILAKFNHPNVVIIHNHGETADHFYFVMQYLEGVTLDRIIVMAKENRFTNASDIFKYVRGEIDVPAPGAAAETVLDPDYFREVVEIVRQTCDALACAHDAGVIHRDVKPQNILYDTYGHAKIMDFGISKLSTASFRTFTQEMVGTPYYISPEMVQDKTVTNQSDIYSLGVVLYELLCLKLPFDDKSWDKLFTAIKTKNPPDIQSIRHEAPADLASLVKICLEKHPADRFQDMRSMKRDLDAYIQGEPPHHTARRATGTKKMAAAAAGLILAAVAGIFVALKFQSGHDSASQSQVSAPAYPARNAVGGKDLKVKLPVVRADAGIGIELSVNRRKSRFGGIPVFRNNEKIRIHVRSTRDGYLRLFYRQANNQWIPLTLDVGKKVYDLRASAEYTFPKHDETGYPIETPPAGEEMILAVVSSIPFDDIAPQTDTDLAQNALAGLPLDMLRREDAQFRGIRNPEDVPAYNSISLKIFTTK